MANNQSQPASPLLPRIHKATRGSLGKVIRGMQITEAVAVVEYAGGNDIVVCGDVTRANRSLARRIAGGVGACRLAIPHTKTAGPYALPHFQPDPRPPDGHVFYETEHRKAAVNP
jgi:hypothetical protein